MAHEMLQSNNDGVIDRQMNGKLPDKQTISLQLSSHVDVRKLKKDDFVHLDLSLAKTRCLDQISPKAASDVESNTAKRNPQNSHIGNSIHSSKKRPTCLRVTRPHLTDCTTSLSNYVVTAEDDQFHSLSNVFYDPEDQKVLMQSSRTVMIGLQSESSFWCPLKMAFSLHPALEDCSFSEVIMQFSHCGTWSRRLDAAVNDIRKASESIQAPLSLSAVASAIERETSVLRNHLEKVANNADTFIELAGLTENLRDDVYMLAYLIGCENLDQKGRLSRIPDAIEILERSYRRAMLLDSPALWRIASAAMKPWLDQLNFVVGLKETSLKRTNSETMKSAFFPEIFIDIDKTTKAAYIVEEAIPSFFPFSMANAVRQCYHFLFIAGAEGSEMDFLSTSIAPVRLGGDVVVQSLKLKPVARLTSNSSTNPLYTLIQEQKQGPDDRELSDNSVQSLSSGSFDSILRRRIESDHTVKQHFRADSEFATTIITDLYLLNNGRFWSSLIDTIPEISTSQRFQALARIQDSVNQEFGHSRDKLLVILAPETNSGIAIEYKPPEVINRMMLPNHDELWLNLKKRFDKLLQSHFTEPKAFRSYSEQIDTAAQHIKHALNSDRAGISELISSLGNLIKKPI